MKWWKATKTSDIVSETMGLSTSKLGAWGVFYGSNGGEDGCVGNTNILTNYL